MLRYDPLKPGKLTQSDLQSLAGWRDGKLRKLLKPDLRSLAGLCDGETSSVSMNFYSFGIFELNWRSLLR